MTMMSSLKALLFATPAKGAAVVSGGAPATPGDAFAALLGGMTGDAADAPMTAGEPVVALPTASVQPAVLPMPEAASAPTETPSTPAQHADGDTAIPAAPLPRLVNAPVADDFPADMLPAAMPAAIMPMPMPMKRPTPMVEPDVASIPKDAAEAESESNDPATSVEADGEIEKKTTAPTPMAERTDAGTISLVIAPALESAPTLIAIADEPVSRLVQPMGTVAPMPAPPPPQDAAVPSQRGQESRAQAQAIAAPLGVHAAPEAGAMPVSPVPAPAGPAPTWSAQVVDAPMPPSSAPVAVSPDVVEGNIQANPAPPKIARPTVPDTALRSGESAPKPSSNATVEVPLMTGAPKATAPVMPVAAPPGGNGEGTVMAPAAPSFASTATGDAVPQVAPDVSVPMDAITPKAPELDSGPAPAPQAPVASVAKAIMPAEGSGEATPVISASQAAPLAPAAAVPFPSASSVPTVDSGIAPDVATPLPAAAVIGSPETQTKTTAPAPKAQPFAIPSATSGASVAVIAPAAPASPISTADSGVAPEAAAPLPAAVPARSEALSLLQLVRDHFVGSDKETVSPRAAPARHGEAADIALPPQSGAGSPVIAPVAAPPPVIAAQPTLSAPAPVDLGGTLATQIVDMGVSGQWIDGLARDIAGLSARGAQGRFEVQAGQLGAVQVDIRPGAAGASVSLTVASDAAQQALQVDSDRLIADTSLSALRIAEVRIDRAPVAEAARADTAGQQQSSQQQSSQQNGSQGQSQQGQGSSGGQSHGLSQNLSQGAGQNRPQNRENLSGNHKAAGESAVLTQADSRDARGDGLRRSAGRARYA